MSIDLKMCQISSWNNQQQNIDLRSIKLMTAFKTTSNQSRVMLPTSSAFQGSGGCVLASFLLCYGKGKGVNGVAGKLFCCCCCNSSLLRLKNMEYRMNFPSPFTLQQKQRPLGSSGHNPALSTPSTVIHIHSPPPPPPLILHCQFGGSLWAVYPSVVVKPTFYPNPRPWWLPHWWGVCSPILRRSFHAASTPYIVLGYKTPDMNKWWAEEQTISPFNC